tara:strand:+ start:1933 stop:3270 length:1338 start_codon:yes stop_codon:yes gene_type:complete
MSSPDQSSLPTDYRIVSFLVRTHSHDKAINIAQHVADIEIYENIELPYLTGSFFMKDEMRFIDGISFNGTETCDITFESQTENKPIITKTFTLVEITDTKKNADNSEILRIRIVENIFFNNNLMKINKAYVGTPDKIIKKIIKDNFNVNINLPKIKPHQKTMKVIIPFLNPFEACEWIRSKMSTELGMPYFFFSTLNDKNLNLISLEEIFKIGPWTQGRPYTFSAAYNQGATDTKLDDNLLNIAAFRSKNKDNVLSLINSSSTAGHHTITDMTTGQSIDYIFDVDKLFEDLIAFQFIDKNHKPIHHSKYEHNGKLMNEYNTSNIHRMVTNNTYNGINNYNEEETTANFRLQACVNAYRNMLFKTSINVTVPGRPYLMGINSSIGRQIEVVYPANDSFVSNTSSVTAIDLEDKKRSGTYIIYATRHTFAETQHNVDITAVKLGNRK